MRALFVGSVVAPAAALRPSMSPPARERPSCLGGRTRVTEPAETPKEKIAALAGRLTSVTKSADLLAVSREIEALGRELAQTEAHPSEFVWPRDLNGGEPSKEWGGDSEGGEPHG